MRWLQKIINLDRRIIFLFVALGTLIPIIHPLGFPIEPTPPVESIYRYIEALKPGSVVMISFDYGPSTAPELTPMAKAVMRHCARKGIKVVGLTYLIVGGADMAEEVMSEIGREQKLTYGVDYVNLGFKSGAPAPMIRLRNDLHGVFPLDNRGTPISSLPMMAGIKGYDDIDFILELASTALGDYWINVVNARFGEPLGMGTTAVSAPRYYAFLDSGQLVGMMGGLKGAAEYEVKLGQRGMASKGMDAQRVVHLMIIFFVVLGNIIFLIERRQASNRNRGY